MSNISQHTTALSDGKNNSGGTGCLLLFGFVFAAFGSIFVYMMLIAPLWHMTAASSWVEVPCTILDSKVGVSHDSDGGNTYRVEVRFAYQFNPTALETDATAPRYESTRYDFSAGMYSSGREAKNAVVRKLKPGSTMTCWVNPQQPGEAVLKRDTPDQWWIGLFTLIFPLAGFGLMYFALHLRRTERLRRAGLLPLTAQKKLTPNLPDDHPTGPVELEQVQSRMGKVIGLGLFALIWNGVTWTMFYFIVIEEWHKSGVFVWFPLIFLSIFLLIGLAVLVGLVHQILALKNPRLKLTVSTGVLHPGDTLELTWECLGNAFRVRSFVLTIVGQEIATYTRGTDTVTEKHVFKRIPVVTIEEHADMVSGRVSVVIPHDVPATFREKNNKIEWHLGVKGDIPRWPDINDEYGLLIVNKRSNA